MWVLTRPILDKFAPALQDRQADAGGAGRRRSKPRASSTRATPRSSICRRRSSTWSCTRGRTAWSIRTRSSARRCRRSARRRRSRCGTACRSSTTSSRATPTRPATTATSGRRSMDADTRDGVRRGGQRVRQADRRRQDAQVHPRAGQRDGSRRGLSPVPRPRSGCHGAAQEAGLPDELTVKERGRKTRPPSKAKSSRLYAARSERRAAGPAVARRVRARARIASTDSGPGPVIIRASTHMICA